MTQSRDDLLDAAMQAQREVGHALHASADPAWLHLDLTMAQLKALFVLADDALTVGQLADTLGIGKPAASILVERLVQLGLVARTEDAQDRRRALVSLTAEGSELATRLRQGGRDRLRAWLDQLDADDLDALVRGMQALSRIATASSAQVAATA